MGWRVPGRGVHPSTRCPSEGSHPAASTLLSPWVPSSGTMQAALPLSFLPCVCVCEGRLQLPAPYLLFLFLIAGEAVGNCRLCFASGCPGGRIPAASSHQPLAASKTHLERVETTAGAGRAAARVEHPQSLLLGHAAVLAATPRLRRPAPGPPRGLPAQGAHPGLGNGLPEEETLFL